MQDGISGKQTINLPLERQADWRKSLPSMLNQIKAGPIEIDCKDWFLSCRDISSLLRLAEKGGFQVCSISSDIPETIISASALGLLTTLNLRSDKGTSSDSKNVDFKLNKPPSLLFQKGTLRSGEHLDTEGDVLLLGDVNPGARVSAGGDVMVWGRLRGIAHAGKSGNQQAKIVALELRPLQLRIADEIARGPEEKPEPGLAEEAHLEAGKIVIKPARTNTLRGNSPQ